MAYRVQFFCLFVGFGLASSLFAQDPLRGALTMGFGDVSAMKQRAAAGDVRAQVALAGTLEGQFHAGEAMSWYRKAASTGDPEAVDNVGRMLLFGAVGLPSSETVPADPVEGLRWTYMAATNFYPKAFGNMSAAYQRGLAVSTNLIEAYAWLQLYQDVEPTLPLGKFHLNELALKMDTASIAQAKALAQRFKQRQWTPLVVCQIPQNDSRLKLNGITWGGRVPLAAINGKALAAGESTTITIRKKPLRVTVLKIEKTSVRISVEGEDRPRELRL